MHFDSVQAHSGQMLMPATHFSLGAATAGLLPDASLLTYPKDAGYTRIVLQQLRPAGYAIRLASLADMPQLLELEAYWRSDVLAAPEAVLRRRLLEQIVDRRLFREAELRPFLQAVVRGNKQIEPALLKEAVRDVEREFYLMP